LSTIYQSSHRAGRNNNLNHAVSFREISIGSRIRGGCISGNDVTFFFRCNISYQVKMVTNLQVRLLPGKQIVFDKSSFLS
jgi:hypothetical protein